MSARVAFLRGINVGGNRKLAMSELRASLTKAGFDKVRTLLQSGNLLLEARNDFEDVEAVLEQLIVARFTMQVDVMVRTAPVLASLIQSNPFPEAAATDPGHVLVLFSKASPGPEALDRLREVIKGREEARLAAGHAFVYYRDGIGTSKLTPNAIERALGCRATGRNWNTVLKVAAALTPWPEPDRDRR